LIPLYWEAVHIDVYGQPAAHRFPVELTPYSAAGDAAMIGWLDASATYADVVSEGHSPNFPNLLLSTENVYTAICQPAPDLSCERRTGSAINLLAEMEQLIDLLDAAGLANTIATESAVVVPNPAASSPYYQAVVLRDACTLAKLQRRALRMDFTVLPRPIDAPIFTYTASVEGFHVIEQASIDMATDALVVTFASGYVYSLSRRVICEVESLDANTRFLEVRTVHDGAGALVVMEDGSSFEWMWSQILKICEPAFIEFGDMEPSKRELLQMWLLSGALRRVHPPA